LKRPVRPGQPAKPSRPVKPVKQADPKLAKAEKSPAKLKPARPAKPAKPAKLAKASKLSKSAKAPKKARDSRLLGPKSGLNAVQVRQEQKRLKAVARFEKRSRIASMAQKLSPDAKRFKAMSKRRRITFGISLGSVAALVALVAATVFTPLLAVETIEIRGLDRIPEKSIRKVLEKQLGKPLPLVNSDEIAADLEKFALIESFSAISQPPHALQVRIRERQPIVIVYSGGQPYLYDPAGVQLGRAKVSDKYPILTIAGSAKNSAEFKAAIDVLLALPATLLPKLSSIDAKSKDNVSMQLRGYAGQRIIWGDGSQSVLKSKVLAALIKNQKRTDRVTFDVSSPTTPVVKY
jgi:cell division protein FtsQ